MALSVKKSITFLATISVAVCLIGQAKAGAHRAVGSLAKLSLQPYTGP